MTDLDLATIKKRLDTLNGIIKANHSLPKDQRNLMEMADAKKRIDVIRTWLKPAKAVEQPVVKSSMSKAEFRQQLKDAIGVGDADTEIELENIAALDMSWPVIKDKIWEGKIMIKAPLVVREEIKKRLRKFRMQKPKGFR